MQNTNWDLRVLDVDGLDLEKQDISSSKLLDRPVRASWRGRAGENYRLVMETYEGKILAKNDVHWTANTREVFLLPLFRNQDLQSGAALAYVTLFRLDPTGQTVMLDRISFFLHRVEPPLDWTFKIYLAKQAGITNFTAADLSHEFILVLMDIQIGRDYDVFVVSVDACMEVLAKASFRSTKTTQTFRFPPIQTEDDMLIFALRERGQTKSSHIRTLIRRPRPAFGRRPEAGKDFTVLDNRGNVLGSSYETIVMETEQAREGFWVTFLNGLWARYTLRLVSAAGKVIGVFHLPTGFVLPLHIRKANLLGDFSLEISASGQAYVPQARLRILSRQLGASALSALAVPVVADELTEEEKLSLSADALTPVVEEGGPKIHVIVGGRELGFQDTVSPADLGTFRLDFDFPQAGAYTVVVAEANPDGEARTYPNIYLLAVNLTGGFAGNIVLPWTLPPSSTEVVVDLYQQKEVVPADFLARLAQGPVNIAPLEANLGQRVAWTLFNVYN